MNRGGFVGGFHIGSQKAALARQSAIAAHPDNAYFWALFARVLRKNGQYEQPAPSQMGYWLEKGARRDFDGNPSTWQKGIAADR
jgi:hypothetical protein